MTYGFEIDPKLDLILERTVDVPPEFVWRAWTEPEHLVKWFTPAPWKTVSCKIDLRPGGLFHTVMQSPEGEKFPGNGCYLEIVPNRKLVWTAALLPGYRPRVEKPGEVPFTATILLEPQEGGTRYTAIAVHRSEDDSKRHADRGFHQGWGKALDQLVAYARQRF